MNITLETVDEVRQRSGVSYREAVEALDKAEGNVVDALVHLEEKQGNSSAVKEGMRRVYQTLQEMRMQFTLKDGSVIDIPVSWGAIGALLFPKWTAWGIMGMMLSQGAIQVKKSDGKSVSEKPVRAAGKEVQNQSS